jgi:hypothetical protein
VNLAESLKHPSGTSAASLKSHRPCRPAPAVAAVATCPSSELPHRRHGRSPRSPDDMPGCNLRRRRAVLHLAGERQQQPGSRFRLAGRAFAADLRTWPAARFVFLAKLRDFIVPFQPGAVRWKADQGKSNRLEASRPPGCELDVTDAVR